MLLLVCESLGQEGRPPEITRENAEKMGVTRRIQSSS